MSTDRPNLGDNPEGDKHNSPPGTSKGKWLKFTPQSGSDSSPYLSTGYKNAKKVARMTERLFTKGVTGVQNEQERNQHKDQALSLIDDIRKAGVDLLTVVKYYDDVKQYILPGRSESSSSHPPLDKALLDGMSLEELQATKEKVQKLQKAADNLSKRNASAQDLSKLVEQAESAKNDLETANRFRPLKHHQTDLAEMQEVVQFGQILKGLDFTTLSQKCKELQRLIELKPKSDGHYDGYDKNYLNKTFDTFSDLRLITHESMKFELKTRINNNPNPTDEEINIGAFIEELEPQVRDAVLDFSRKGYSTSSSGFYGKNAEIQAIDGYFTLDKKTRKKLEAMNVEVNKESDGSTWVLFYPETPNLEAIKEKWARITALIPDKGKIAPPSESFGSEMFRERYAS